VRAGYRYSATGDTDASPCCLEAREPINYNSLRYWGHMDLSLQEAWDNIHAAHPVLNEWYLDGAAACSVLLGMLKCSTRPARRVLHIGCGTSELGELLAAEGYNVTNIDFSPVCIEACKASFPGSADRYSCADAANLRCAAGAYDIVVDKGTLDAVLQRERKESRQKATAIVLEALRALGGPSGGAMLIVLSIIEPGVRAPLLLQAVRDANTCAAQAGAARESAGMESAACISYNRASLSSHVASPSASTSDGHDSAASAAPRAQASAEGAVENAGPAWQLQVVEVAATPLEMPDQASMWAYIIHGNALAPETR
jgi:SAM-dependent methyltransferase